MTDKIKLNLKNCYGIRELKAELEFKHKGYAIYAPNGVMKTSLAKTMIDLSKGDEPKDEAFPDRTTTCQVTWNDELIKEEEIFVVRSYDDKYSAGGVSTLLANETLKAKYETIHKDIGEAKKSLNKKLRFLAGYREKSRENLDSILVRIFGKTYYEALLDIKSEIDALEEEDFGDANYTIIFNQKVINLIKEDTLKNIINDYVKKYRELTEDSPILGKVFQYHNINQVHQQLKSNNFFAAGHTISLCDKNDRTKEELETDSSLQDRIEEEKQRVFNDPGLQQKFDTFNSKLKNRDLHDFRDYITQNQHILPYLKDLETFERKLWLQYLSRSQPEYNLLIEKYKKGKAELDKIILEAEKDKNDWDNVIADFNSRFLYLPFQLKVKNKSDVILKDDAPSVVFDFIDGKDQRQYSDSQKSDLLRVLSTGEARALYILNIMFEVHTRWKSRKKTLFVFDDIANSFDYKNKFAIIDYLDHIIKSEDTKFIAIVLTHNFDFLRTIESREICQANQCYIALRNQGHITLAPFENRSGIRNPFQWWPSRLCEAEIQIAYIPFLRNLIEYTHGIKDKDGNCNEDYENLTKMLHYKDGTEDLKIQNYKCIFVKHFKNLDFPNVDLSKDIMSYIKETANNCLSQQEGINLEHKIVLSIAIRILAEKFMIEKIRSVEPDYDSTKKQMGKLLQDFKVKFNNLNENIKLLTRINLITPANIHLNSFMYEPILDMGFGELKSLYKEAINKLA